MISPGIIKYEIIANLKKSFKQDPTLGQNPGPVQINPGRVYPLLYDYYTYYIIIIVG